MRIVSGLTKSMEHPSAALSGGKDRKAPYV